MRSRNIQRAAAALFIAMFGRCAGAQIKAYTWREIRDRFESTNPTLLAGRINIDEDRAEEVTAFLRPNPDYSFLNDGFQILPHNGVWQPFAGVLSQNSVSYLHERRNKRELRLASAQGATKVAQSQLADQERTMLFTLRSAFIAVLQAKAVLSLARENLNYYDQLLKVRRDRKQAGDIAQVDLDRLELQRVQYESDVQTGEVNLRTNKIQLQMLLNDRASLEQFDITGPFDFPDSILPLEQLRTTALETRPDLKAAKESVEKAKTDYKLAVANGSTDPTFSVWWTHNGSFANADAYNTVGASVSIPLRIFDRNQGEKQRTRLDVSRNERLASAAESQVYSDVDSAYATLNSNLTLLKAYRERYLAQASRVRSTISYSYEHGGASLLDFLQAQQDYRTVQVSYLNLIGSYLTAASQLNEAVGREVLQ